MHDTALSCQLVTDTAHLLVDDKIKKKTTNKFKKIIIKCTDTILKM